MRAGTWHAVTCDLLGFVASRCGGASVKRTGSGGLLRRGSRRSDERVVSRTILAVQSERYGWPSLRGAVPGTTGLSFWRVIAVKEATLPSGHRDRQVSLSTSAAARPEWLPPSALRPTLGPRCPRPR